MLFNPCPALEKGKANPTSTMTNKDGAKEGTRPGHQGSSGHHEVVVVVPLIVFTIKLARLPSEVKLS